MDTAIIKGETLKARICEILRSNVSFDETADGVFCCEIYADYRDEMSLSSVLEILEADYPCDVFYEKLMEWYEESECWYFNETVQYVMKEIENADKDEVIEILQDLVCFDYPAKHFLDQKFCTNIMIDTGDGNYDFVSNCVYPHYNGDYETEIEDVASLVWLAETQGYSKAQLWSALQQGDLSDAQTFLESVRVEVANMASHMGMLVLLVEMTFDQLLKLNKILKEKTNEGYIIVSKKTMTGLYDAWYGGGSIFDIQLEKDVKIPFQYIRSALPDGHMRTAKNVV